VQHTGHGALTAVPTTSVTTSVTSRQPASALTSSVDAGLPCPHSRSHNCPPPALQLNVLLPWMHGFDHDLPCQLENSGLYKVCLLLLLAAAAAAVAAAFAGLLPLACCRWPAGCCRGWLLPLLPWLAVAAADCCNAGCCFLLRLLLLPLVLQIA
jgi:hypothetical protein